MKQPYIGVLPGHIKDGDDTRTNLLTVLGMEDLAPMSIGDYNDGYHTPPVAAVEIDGEQYSLKAVLSKVNERITSATPDDTTVNGRAWTSKKTVDSLCMPLEATGNPVQVYPVEGYPLGVKVSWEPTQAGSGDPSPDNIRPITGRDAVSVTRCGKNLVGDSHVVKSGVYGGVSYTINDDKTITVSGTPTNNVALDIISYTAGKRRKIYPGTYTLSGGLDNIALVIVVYDGNESDSKQIVYQKLTTTDGTITFTIDAISYFGLYTYIYTNQTVNGVMKPQLELGPTATPYEPYTGSTTDIALPETVYGGTLDVETGVVTVDMGITIADGTTNKFYSGETWGLPHRSSPGIVETYWGGDITSSHFKWALFGGNKRYEFIYTSSQKMAGLFDTADALNAYLVEQNAAGTPVTFVYKLATPYTIQLSPQQIAALSGVNTLYTDAGTLTVTGREDPLHTIVTLTDRIAALESAAAGV